MLKASRRLSRIVKAAVHSLRELADELKVET